MNTKERCPRCQKRDADPVLLGPEGHICGECWVQDREAEARTLNNGDYTMPTDTERLDFLEQLVRKSRTGFSVDWIPSVEGEKSGYRLMTFHNIREPHSTLRKTIDTAIDQHSR